MAKKNAPVGTTQFAETSAAEAEAAREAALAARQYVLDESAWENEDAIEFGGQSDILLLEVDEVGGPFKYIGHQPMQTDLGMTTVHIASDKEGNTIRMPISAAFVRSADQAGLSRGDTFIVKRYPDTLKKTGKGKGQTMQIYALKVTSKAPVVGA